MTRRMKLHRRTILRGAAGVSISLPVLECMLNDNGTAYAQGQAIPKRYAIVFAGQALGGDDYEKNVSRINGQTITREGDFIAPPQSGAGYDITTPLRPIEHLRDDFSLVSGMRIPYDVNSAEASAVPAGGQYTRGRTCSASGFQLRKVTSLRPLKRTSGFYEAPRRAGANPGVE